MAVYRRDNGMWRVDVWWDGVVVWSTHTPTKGEGDEIHDEIKTALRKGVPEPWRRYEVAPREERLTVGTWIEKWRQGRGLKPRTTANQNSLIDNHIIPALGKEPLEDLTRLKVQRWVKALDKDLMPRSIRTVYAILSEALGDAADDPSTPIQLSPAHRIRLPKPDPTGREKITSAQLAILVYYAGDRGHIVEDLAFTGMRAAEYCARRRHDLTIRKTIEIAGRPTEGPAATEDGERAKRPVRGKRGRTRQPAAKSPAGARSILLCEGHAAAWSARLAGHDLDSLAGVRAGRSSGQRGHPVPVGYWMIANLFQHIREAAVEDGHDIPARISAHWLRLFHRVLLEDALVPERAVDEQLGHEPEGVKAAYRRVTPKMQRMIRDALQETWVEYQAALTAITPERSAAQ